MPVVIYDPLYEQHVRAERERRWSNERDEVWEGVLVVPPMPNNEHQILVMSLSYAFASGVNRAGGDGVLPGANVSDYSGPHCLDQKVAILRYCFVRPSWPRRRTLP